MNLTNHARQRGRWLRQAIGLAVLLLALFEVEAPSGAETAALTEYQVKALFLLNFTKYVDWPAEAFAKPDAPIIIGIVGQNNFGDDLAHAIEGKSVNGRKVTLISPTAEDDWPKCHILFIGASEKKGVAEIIARLRTLPILTVGETDQFIQQGGIVNFTRRDGKIRLEIEVDAAQQAKLQISSRLLHVADAVRGKH